MAVSEHLKKLITETEDMGEYLKELLVLEVEREQQRAVDRRLKIAKFPYK